MVDSIMEKRIPENFKASLKIMPRLEEERYLGMIEQESNRVTRREFEENLSRYDKKERRVILAQIAHYINVSRISQISLIKGDKEAGVIPFKPNYYIDTNATLKALAESSKHLPAEQLSDMVLVVTKLAEQKKDTKDAAVLLSKLSAHLSDEQSKKLLSISIKFVENEWNLDSFLKSISKMSPQMRAKHFDGLMLLSERMVEKGMNPKPAVSYICELPASILETHGEKVIELSKKLVDKGVDPKGMIWSITMLPPEQVNINLLLSEALKQAERIDPKEKILLISQLFPRLVDRRQVDRIVNLAHANVNRGLMKIEECWEMEKSMNSLLAYSPEKFENVSGIAEELLRHNINPNDLFLLSKSLIQYSTKNFEGKVEKIAELMVLMKETKWDVALSSLFYSSEEFQESGFNNYLLYKLNRTLQNNPNKFDGQIERVIEKLNSGDDPRKAFG
ncbi:MAG: hypothetical protein QXF56_05490 [Candidatus Micrarchaeia archaeon]